MTKNDLIEIIINSPSINRTLNKLEPYELRDDMRQYFYLEVCEETFEKLFEVYNRCDVCLERWAGQLIKNQFKNTNSPFYKMYRKDKTNNYDVERLVELYNWTESNDSLENTENVLRNIDKLLVKFHNEDDYDLMIDKNYQRVRSFLNHIHPRRSKLFIEHWINGKTIRQISKQYRIKYSTVIYNIRTTEQLIRDNLKFQNE